jgi:hypothetical protein
MLLETQSAQWKCPKIRSHMKFQMKENNLKFNRLDAAGSRVFPCRINDRGAGQGK